MLLRLFRRGGASILGPLEAEVMDAVWDAQAAVTVGDVHRKLSGKGRKIAYSTVKAVLTNLSEKGHLKKKSQGRSNVFSAVDTREQFKERTVRDVLSSLVKDHRAPLMAHLVNDLATDRESVEELERLIQERRKQVERSSRRESAGADRGREAKS